MFGTSDPRRRGAVAERLAAEWLRARGFEILDTNRAAAGGEIDILAKEQSTLVFVEVRLRRADAWVGASASISRQKWQRMRRCARELAQRPQWRWPGRSFRFDVVAVTWGTDRVEMEYLGGVGPPGH